MPAICIVIKKWNKYKTEITAHENGLYTIWMKWINIVLQNHREMKKINYGTYKIWKIYTLPFNEIPSFMSVKR